jgi:hypothetical protein
VKSPHLPDAPAQLGDPTACERAEIEVLDVGQEHDLRQRTPVPELLSSEMLLAPLDSFGFEGSAETSKERGLEIRLGPQTGIASSTEIIGHRRPISNVSSMRQPSNADLRTRTDKNVQQPNRVRERLFTKLHTAHRFVCRSTPASSVLADPQTRCRKTRQIQ